MGPSANASLQVRIRCEPITTVPETLKRCSLAFPGTLFANSILLGNPMTFQLQTSIQPHFSCPSMIKFLSVCLCLYFFFSYLELLGSRPHGAFYLLCHHLTQTCLCLVQIAVL